MTMHLARFFSTHDGPNGAASNGRRRGGTLTEIACWFVATWSLTAVAAPTLAQSPAPMAEGVMLGPYEYETKPDHEAFYAFNPRKAPSPGPLLLQPGDRLAICGDSITEQKMYSRIIESYLTACWPQWTIRVRQYGWSGERTDGFLRRMEKDVLTFEPTVATLAYGMNDSRYRPFDVTNGRWYEDHYTAIVRRFKERGVRVVVGSPGCAGKLAEWVKPRAGTLEDHNLQLCALRDLAMMVAEREDARFADIFWPMYQAQVFAPAQHQATPERPYAVAGRDGIHPDWAGQTVMAWAFLRAMGIEGNLAEFAVDWSQGKAHVSEGHRLESFANGQLTIESTRYPFCAEGELDSDGSIRSGMTLVPFDQDLNRWVLRCSQLPPGQYLVTWGEVTREFPHSELEQGINLAHEFPINPFNEAFRRVDQAVAAKQAFETVQVKERFHGPRRQQEFAAVVAETEAERGPLADAVAHAVKPVKHTLTIRAK